MRSASRSLVLKLVCLFMVRGVMAVEVECPPLDHPKAFVTCLSHAHPAMLRADADLSQKKFGAAAAGQWINPNVDSKMLYGEAQSDPVVNLEIYLTHTFELGGKRSSRIQKALADENLSAATKKRVLEELTISWWLDLYRYQQILKEEHILTDAIDNLGSIQKQYKIRRRLSPDQEVSITVFNTAREEAIMRRMALQTELEAIVNKIKLSLGDRTPKQIDPLIPKKISNWPTVDNLSISKESPAVGSGLFKNARTQLAESELQQSQALYEIEKSQSWPNLQIGPGVEAQRQGIFSYVSYGVTFSFSLPVYQANGARRAYALKGLEKSELNSFLTKNEIEIERELYLKRYQDSVELLKRAMEASHVETKHKRMEKLFSLGIVPSPLIIEAHRQMFEFTKTQNQRELAALEALLRIYMIDGKLFDQSL